MPSITEESVESIRTQKAIGKKGAAASIIKRRQHFFMEE